MGAEYMGMKKAMKKKAAAPAPKAMKAMKKAMKKKAAAPAPKAMKAVKKSGSFKLAGMLNLKLKDKPATKARKGINPFTKEPCVFKAKPASKTVKCFAMKKLKELL